MPHPSFRPSADISVLSLFQANNLLSQEEIEKLNDTERANLNHELVFRYIQSKVITIDRAKSLSRAEFLRLTNYSMINLFTDKIYPLEELLTLSTRRAQILSAPNVLKMMSRDMLSPEEAIELDSTFEFLDENKELEEDVIYYGYTPQFALEVHTLYIHLSTLFLINRICEDCNRLYAEMYNIQLTLDPKTATQCCIFVYAIDIIMEEINNVRREILDSLSDDLREYVLCSDTLKLKYYPPSLRLDTREIIGQSDGYRDYCLKIIKDSFRFLRSPISNDAPISRAECGQSSDRRLKTIGLQLNSMWQKATRSEPKLVTEEKLQDPSIRQLTAPSC